MKRAAKQYDNLFTTGLSPERRQILADLEHFYMQRALSPTADHAIRVAIRGHAPATIGHDTRLQRRRPLRSLLPACALVLGIGSAAIWRAAPLAPVSAQTIVQRAVVQLPANEAEHTVYREYSSVESGIGTSWRQGNRELDTLRLHDNDGQTTLSETLRMRGVVHTFNYEIDPGITYAHEYTATDAKLAADTAKVSATNALLGTVSLSGPRAAAYLQQLMQHSPAGVHLLPKRYLNGVLVYPVHVDLNAAQRQPGFTVYFDARSYVVRGVDITRQVSGRIADSWRLVSDQVVPASQVPPHTFELHQIPGSMLLP